MTVDSTLACDIICGFTFKPSGYLGMPCGVMYEILRTAVKFTPKCIGGYRAIVGFLTFAWQWPHLVICI